VLSQKLQKPVADAVLGRLRDYITGKTVMTQPEVSFACYIFGETGNPDGKDILLQLTYDENYRVRSSAINALGKIKYDRANTEFIKKVSERLSVLAGEKNERKLYSKDIAFALGNYVSNESFDALMGMLDDPYYGARFVAAGNLSKFDQLRLLTATDNSLPGFPKEIIPLVAFMQSLNELSETDFIIFESFIKLSPVFESDAVVINLCEAIKLKKNRSVNQGFTNWCDIEINFLQGKIKSVIR
jgi:HEAT repeat protein